MTNKELKVMYEAGDPRVSKYIQRVYKSNYTYEYECYRLSIWDESKHRPPLITRVIPEDELINDGVLWKRIPNSCIWCSEDGKHISRWIQSKNEFTDYYQKDEHGYKTVTVTINKKKYNTTSSRVIAYCFGLLESLDSDMDVDHINEIRNDNRIENLRVLTHQENCQRRKCTNNVKIELYNENESHIFNSKSEAARWILENGISNASLESIRCNLSTSKNPYGYNIKALD